MRKKHITAIAATMFMSLASITSFAATKITSAEVTIDGSFEEGTSDNDVTVTETSAKYDVQTAKVQNNKKNGWESGDKPKIKITLKSKKNYEWGDINSGSIDVEGLDGSVGNVSKSGNKLTFVYTLDAIGSDDYDGDLDVSNVSISDGTVYWDGAEDASKFEVKLYRGSKLLKTQTTSQDEYDFSNMFTQSGTYKAKVRGIKGSSHKGSWVESDEFTVTSDEASEIRSEYNENKKATSSDSSDSDSSSTGKKCPSVPKESETENTNATFGPSVGGETANGESASAPQSQWVQVVNTWFYYDPATNSFATNQYINGLDGKTYYVGPTGAMLASSYTPDFQHYCGADGALVF